VQHDRKQECEKVVETQLEISRLQLKVAHEQKEAKLLEVYSSLLQQYTSQLSDQGKIKRLSLKKRCIFYFTCYN
jgi:outer membrane lipopolysaccharide assembly protein LptE/RlpB